MVSVVSKIFLQKTDTLVVRITNMMLVTTIRDKIKKSVSVFLVGFLHPGNRNLSFP